MTPKKQFDVHFRVPLWWPDLPGNWRAWLPSRGNVLFTLLLIACLLWAQSAGALPVGRVTNAPSQASTTTIAYQGRLADADGNPLTGTYNMIFRLYDVPTGGTPLWEEQWTGSNGVRVSDGLFNVMLGSLNPIGQDVIAGHDQLWIGITVGTDDEMQPRVQLGSVPYAVQALTVPDGSITTAKIADGAVTQAKLAAGSVTRNKFASMTGIAWKTPPATFYEPKAWSPSENAVWDITQYLQQAGVPADVEMILLGWRPSLISDVSWFELLNGDNQVLDTLLLGTTLPTLEWSPVALEYGVPIPVPGATRKIKYSRVGGYRQAPTTTPRRTLVVFGWK